MVDAATSIIRYKHISASLYSANSVSTISFYHVLRQISIVLSHYVEIFLILASLGVALTTLIKLNSVRSSQAFPSCFA